MYVSADQASAELLLLYTTLFGRSPDAAATTALLPALEAGFDPSVLRAQLALGSGEAAADITNLYTAELGHAPDSAGLTAFLEALAIGSLSLAGVRVTLAATAEASDAVDLLYQQMLGRPADPPGNAQFVTALASGFSLGDVRQQLAGSLEASNTLDNLYQDVLDRPIDAGGRATFTALLQSGASLNDVRVDLARSPEADATLTRSYELTFGSAPAATVIAAQQAELALGRSFSDTITATRSTMNASPAVLTGNYYYYNIPPQFTTKGLPADTEIVVAIDNSVNYNGSVSSIPTPVIDGTRGPDAIVLNVQTLSGNPQTLGGGPITFAATLDAQPIGTATITAPDLGGTETQQTQDQLTFTGSFGAVLHDLNLHIIAGLPGSLLNVVSGATFDGSQFLIGAVQSNAAATIDIFPHPGPQPNFLTPGF